MAARRWTVVLAIAAGCGGAQVPPSEPPPSTSDVDASVVPARAIAPSARFASMPLPRTCLPASVEALLVVVWGNRALLDPHDASYALGASGYALLPLDGRLRMATTVDGTRLDEASARALGVDGTALVEARIASAPCTADPDAPFDVPIVSLRRLDGTPVWPSDLGASLGAVLQSLDGDHTLQARLDAEARAAIHAEVPDARLEPRTMLALGLRLTHDPAELEILYAMRALGTISTEAENDAPQAGSFGCSAPPGADCAPQCIPPRIRTTRTTIGEAAVRVIVGPDGRTLRTEPVPAGALDRHPETREGVGECMH